jgi:hypothetical protein
LDPARVQAVEAQPDAVQFPSPVFFCLIAFRHTRRIAHRGGIDAQAPEGAINDAALYVCLKAYPDTNLEFFRSLQSRALQQRVLQ